MQSRTDAIKSDVSNLILERLTLIVALTRSDNAERTAILQRRIDKIEERFSDIGLDRHGVELE